MPSMKLFLFLVLATALNRIIEAHQGPEDAFKSTTSLSNGNARVTTYSSSDMSVPAIVYELKMNSSTLGDAKFLNNVGLLYGVEALQFASEIALYILYQGQKPGPGKDYCEVEAVIESFSRVGLGGSPLEVAKTVANKIRMNSDYILNFDGDLPYEFRGIMHHESTRIWQWNGNGMAPEGLITGIADYVRLVAGFPSVNWGKRGEGERWDQGYAVTAYFLEYLNTVKSGSIVELNDMMKDYYYEFYFNLIFGASVEDLWIDYKLFSEVPFLSLSLSPAPAPAV